MKYTKEQVLRIVDSCFHMYASDYRTDAKDNAVEIMNAYDKQNVANGVESKDGKIPIPHVTVSLPTDEDITKFAESSTEPFTRRGDNMSMPQTWITLGAVWMRNILIGNER
jgi:hypothetical protein